jgi:hypothetical protein
LQPARYFLPFLHMTATGPSSKVFGVSELIYPEF